MAELAALNVKITGDASGIKAAANSAQKSVETFTKSAESSARVFERAFSQNERSVDRLRKSIDPLYAASKRYEAAVETLDKALKAGTITQTQHARLLDQTGAAYLTAGGQAARAATSFSRASLFGGAMGSRLQQVGFQLQDVAIQLQAGTRASVVFAQQGSQIASVFGPVGAIIGTLAAVGIPLLAVAFANGATEARTLEDAMTDLQAISSGLKSTQDILGMSVEDMVEKYGRYAGQVRMAAEELARLQIAQAQNQLTDSIVEASDAINEFIGRTQSAFSSGKMMGQAINDIAKELNISFNEARALYDALSDVQQAVSFDDRLAALRELQAIMESAAIDTERLPPALVDAMAQAAGLVIQMAEVANQAERASAAVAGMTTGVPLYEQDTGGSLVPGAAPTVSAGGGRRRAGGGGGGGGANPIVAQLESLRQSLMSQEEAQIASFTRQQETLQAALEQRLITQQEYQTLMEESQRKHAEALAQIDVWRYGDGLQRAGAFFGSMADAFANGNEDMLRVSKAFGAAEALINAWRAYSQTIADPSLPWFAKLAAGLKVLSAGMGAVNAIKGVGKGGSGGGAVAANSNAAPLAPLEVRLNGISPGSLYSGADIGSLLDRLSDEAGDRGYRLMIAR